MTSNQVKRAVETNNLLFDILAFLEGQYQNSTNIELCKRIRKILQIDIPESM